jgi:hypothetical protein
LIDKIGIEKMVYSFPELSNLEAKPFTIQTPQGEVELNPVVDNGGKLINALIQLPLPENQRRKVDQILLDFKPLTKKDSESPEEVFTWRRGIELRLAKYYLRHREELRFPSKVDEMPVPSISRKSLEQLEEELWELNAITPLRRKIFEEVYRENYRWALAQWRENPNQWVLRYDLGENIQGVALLTPEEIRKGEKTLSQGGTYLIPGPYGRILEPKDQKDIIKYPVDANFLVQSGLNIMVHWPIHHLRTELYVLGKAIQDPLREIHTKAMDLLLLNADPQWVAAQFEAKILELYSKYREKFLARTNFGPAVEALPEVAGVPLHVLLGQSAREDVGSVSLEDYRSADLFLRVNALLVNAMTNEPSLNAIMKKILGKTAALAGAGEEISHHVAREYLRFRSQIRNHLGPWPAPPVYANVAEEVANYPEIISVPKETLEASRNRIVLSEDERSFLGGDEDLILRILHRLRELAQMGHPEMHQAFQKAARREFSPRDDLLPEYEWYKSHRDEIMQLLKGDKGVSSPVADPVQTVRNFPEIQAITEEHLVELRRDIEVVEYDKLFGIRDLLLGDELFSRILALVNEPGSSDRVKRKFYHGLIQLKKAGGVDPTEGLRFATNFYIEYRPMIQKPALAASQHPEVREVAEYAELKRLPFSWLHYPEGVETPAEADLRGRIGFLNRGKFGIPEVIRRRFGYYDRQVYLQPDEDAEVKLARLYKENRLQFIRALMEWPGAEPIREEIFINTFKEADGLPELQNLDPKAVEEKERNLLKGFSGTPVERTKKFTRTIAMIMIMANGSKELEDELEELFSKFSSGERLTIIGFMVADWYLRNRHRIPDLVAIDPGKND